MPSTLALQERTCSCGALYARYRLGYADLAERLAERGLRVDRSPVYRRVRRILPLLGGAAGR